MSNEAVNPNFDLAEGALELVKRWKANNLAYFDECLGIEIIWKLQKDLAAACYRALKERKPIFIGSGHSLGKDYICGAIANWFLDCFIPSKVILTAPSDRQVKKIMWAETLGHFNRKKVKLWGTAFTSPYIEIRKEDWWLLGFSTKDTGAAAAAGGGKFQGVRAAKNMCVIVTESQAMEDTIHIQIDAVATGENVLVIYLGNPTQAKGFFAAGLKDPINNIVFNFSCLDNPNYKERKIVVPGLTTYEWVEDKRRRWGEGDPRWIGRVLGQVPDNALSNTFPESWINHCRERCGFLAIHLMDSGVAVDSAAEGVDDNVIMSGRGGEVMDVYTKTLMTPVEVATKAVEMCKAINGHFVIFDCDGVGARDYRQACAFSDDYLRGIQILKFHGSAPSQEVLTIKNKDGKDVKKQMYENLRAEASFVTRDRGLAGKCSINEHDKELIDDLMEEEYFENKKGVLQIEPKVDLKERLERSPGRGDAYKMLQWAFAQEIKDETYADTPTNRMPKYGLTAQDVPVSPGQQHRQQNLPSYGRTD